MDADIVIEPIADSSPVVYIIVELCMEKYAWLQSFKLKLHQVESQSVPTMSKGELNTLPLMLLYCY